MCVIVSSGFKIYIIIIIIIDKCPLSVLFRGAMDALRYRVTCYNIIQRVPRESLHSFKFRECSVYT